MLDAKLDWILSLMLAILCLTALTVSETERTSVLCRYLITVALKLSTKLIVSVRTLRNSTINVLASLPATLSDNDTCIRLAILTVSDTTRLNALRKAVPSTMKNESRFIVMFS